MLRHESGRRAGVRAAWARESIDPRRACSNDVTVEEDERTKRLLVSRCADSLRNEVVEKALDLRGAELRRVAPVVEDDVTTDPAAIGPLGAKAVVTAPKFRRESFEQARRPRRRGTGVHSRWSGRFNARLRAT